MSHSKYVVEFVGSCLENKNEMHSVLSPLAKMLEMRIVVSNPHNDTSEPESIEGTLFIKFWSTPTETTAKEYRKVFGIDMAGGQCDGFEATGTGVTLEDDEGVVVAEIHGNNLYILFDLPHGENVYQLLTKIMNEFLLYFMLSPEEKMEIQRVRDEKKNEEARVFLRNMSFEQLDEKIEQSDQDIRNLNASVLEYQESIIKALRRRREEIRKNKFLKECKEKADVEMSDVLYNQLIELSATSLISVNKGGIYVPVGQIDVEYEGKIYDIGEFTIIIHTDGEHGGVQCINNTRTVDEGYYHPHVDSDGDCCLGNISHGIAKLVGEMEYAIAVTMMIEFLKSVYEEGWYSSITNWPVKGELEEEHDSED